MEPLVKEYLKKLNDVVEAIDSLEKSTSRYQQEDFEKVRQIEIVRGIDISQEDWPELLKVLEKLSIKLTNKKIEVFRKEEEILKTFLRQYL